MSLRHKDCEDKFKEGRSREGGIEGGRSAHSPCSFNLHSTGTPTHFPSLLLPLHLFLLQRLPWHPRTASCHTAVVIEFFSPPPCSFYLRYLHYSYYHVLCSVFGKGATWKIISRKKVWKLRGGRRQHRPSGKLFLALSDAIDTYL